MSKNIAIAIIGIQLFDIVIHVETDQAEWLRTALNGIIVTWIITLMRGRLPAHVRLTSYSEVIVYILLNMLFIAIYDPNGWSTRRTGPGTGLYDSLCHLDLDPNGEVITDLDTERRRPAPNTAIDNLRIIRGQHIVDTQPPGRCIIIV